MISTGIILYEGTSYSKNDVIFSACLLLPIQTTENVIANTPSKVYTLSKIDFELAISEHPDYKQQCMDKYTEKSEEIEITSIHSSEHPPYIPPQEASIELKISNEIIELLASADPYLLESEERDRVLEQERLEYVQKDRKRDYVALDRPIFKELAEAQYSAREFPIDHNIDDLKYELFRKKEELREEISLYTLTLRSILSTPIENLLKNNVIMLKDILDECDVLVKHDDPALYLQGSCKSRIQEPSIKAIIDEIVELSALANRYKDYFLAINGDIERNSGKGVGTIKESITREGLLPQEHLVVK